MRRFLMVLAALWLLTGCAKRYELDSYGSSKSYSHEDDVFMDMVPPVAPPQGMHVSRSAQSESNISTTMSGASPQLSATAAAPTARMVFYNGLVELRVTKTDESIEAIKGMVEALGGTIESRSGRHVTVRVPVARFSEAMEQAMALGDVLSRSVTAEDVTEAYTAIDLRLATARATRDRLVELLARATEESEKIALLKQIQRVNEKIDVTESQLRTLSSLARFSRLTITLVPRQAFADRSHSQDAVGLGWIQDLSPFARSVGDDERRVSVDTPDGLVVLSPRGRFIAESADGAVLWTGRVPNEPRGDAEFWVSAISGRLSAEFESASVTTVGPWTMLRLVSDGDTPYRYLIGVIDTGKKLELVEIYYPSAEQEERYGEQILASLRGGEG
ncbi:MAG: DUF4349 domain-containing protein [Myxococcota bacterium]|nr:DUF4349 domain-containing protein [Myxococcota bacterium]